MPNHETRNLDPHVTVAALVEHAGRFHDRGRNLVGLRINQPAGHLEAGETLADAVIRETLEETAHPFTPDALVGVYLALRPPRHRRRDLRFTFCGTASEPIAGHALDDGIVRTLWMTADELRACGERHRSPAVMRCVDDYLAGRRIPLDFVHTHSVAPRPEAFERQAVNK